VDAKTQILTGNGQSGKAQHGGCDVSGSPKANAQAQTHTRTNANKPPHARAYGTCALCVYNIAMSHAQNERNLAFNEQTTQPGTPIGC
jgi:hypothetical protein